MTSFLYFLKFYMKYNMGYAYGSEDVHFRDAKVFHILAAYNLALI